MEQVKPILKLHEEDDHQKGEDHHIKWDEDNLMYNEAHKSATMKIDEPPTPYSHETLSEDSKLIGVKDEEDMLEESELLQLNTKLNSLKEDLEEEDNHAASHFKDANMEEDEDDEEKKKKKEQFEKRRKAHYDEFHRVKGLKSHDDD